MRRPVNLTPYTLTAYEGRALILDEHPAAYIEITDETGKVIEC